MLWGSFDAGQGKPANAAVIADSLVARSRYNRRMTSRALWLLVAGLTAIGVGVGTWALKRPKALTVVAAVEAPLAQSLVFSGRVASRVRVELGSTITGRIVEVLVREGDTVTAGQLLARLDGEELRAQVDQTRASLELARARIDGQRDLAQPTSRATLAQAEASLVAAQREAQRNRELLARGFVAQARVDDADRAVQIAQAQRDAAQATVKVNQQDGNEVVQARLRVREAEAAASLAQARWQQSRLLAPVAGRIVARSVEPGQIVQPGRTLFQFAADGETLLVGQADEKFLALLAPGQGARVVVDAYPTQPFDARIASIAPGVDAARGTVEVKFRADQLPAFVREDMTLSLQVEVGRKARALVLPATAVLGAGREGKVRTIVDGRVLEQPVRVGLRTLDRVELLEGLKPGTQVLAEPLQAEPGTRARAAEPRSPAPAGTAAAG